MRVSVGWWGTSIVTKDAIVHWLESIAKQLQTFEQKYGMPFEQFDGHFQAEALPNQDSDNEHLGRPRLAFTDLVDW